MSIKVFWTRQGQILGTVTGEDSSSIEVENPVVIVTGPQGVALVPLLLVTQETVATFNKSEILLGGVLYEPQDELRNHYSSQFGSGIQLLT